MRYLLLVAVVVGLCPGWVSADSDLSKKATLQPEGNVDYWSKIFELSKKGTPQGSPELMRHLKTLTKDQILEAARQAERWVETALPKSEWPGMSVALPLACYADEKGRLTDKELDKLLACISDQKEGALFRETLVRFVGSDDWCQLTENQGPVRNLVSGGPNGL